MNTKEESAHRLRAANAKFAQVPAAFSWFVHMGTVSVVQPKLLMTSSNGRFYMPGCTLPELYRGDCFAVLARKLAQKRSESRARQQAYMAGVELPGHYLPRPLVTKCIPEAEARWPIRRTAEGLSWPIPQPARTNEQHAGKA